MSEGPCRHPHGRSGATIPFPHGASPQQRVPTLCVLIVTVCAAAVAGELALEGTGPGLAGQGCVCGPPSPHQHTSLFQPVPPLGPGDARYRVAASFLGARQQWGGGSEGHS